AGDICEQVDVAQPLDGRLDGRLDFLRPAQVGDEAVARAAQLRDALGRLSEELLRAVDSEQSRPRLGERQGGLEAHAAAAAEHERVLAVEPQPFEVHSPLAMCSATIMVGSWVFERGISRKMLESITRSDPTPTTRQSLSTTR